MESNRVGGVLVLNQHASVKDGCETARWCSVITDSIEQNFFDRVEN